MASLIPGYEYDIFISYRHNDNLDGWVSEFVQNLEKELRSTIKEPISIYFDTNPHDGLLETHNVDKSLEGKLKCLIFIPIISQTYCDPKSFAWQNEFCVFNKLAKEDLFGSDIKLNNGNVASRILPVKIHEIDKEDTELLEKELSGILRAIEFIYKETGVNRPLRPTDDRKQNLGKTDYRNQVNKVANAIKEIIYSLNHPSSKSGSTNYNKLSGMVQAPGSIFRKVIIPSFIILLLAVIGYFLYPKISEVNKDYESSDKSIAVLAFEDMSPGKDQEYLGDGIAEEIINVLTRIEGLHVIGRTSSFSFKGKNDDLITIGKKLGAGTILEGSIRKSDNHIRVTAQLIDSRNGNHIWSETYDRELIDIFKIQDDISARIAERFEASINSSMALAPPTQNTDAYELYLRGKQAMNRGIAEAESSRDYLLKSISLDSTFVLAYAALSHAYFSLRIYDIGDSELTYRLARSAALKAIELDPDSYAGYIELSWINFTTEWDWAAGKTNYNKALSLGLPQPDPYRAYYLSLLGHNDESIQIMKDVLKKDPLSAEYLLSLSRIYIQAGRYSDAIANCEKIETLYPDNTSNMRHLGISYLFSGNPQKALAEYSKLWKMDPNYSPQGYIGALVKLGRREEALKVLHNMPKSVNSVKKAFCFIYLNEPDSVFKYLEEGYKKRDIKLSFIQGESEFKLIKDDPRYKALVKRMNFPKDF